jgi:hypothetical protein
MFGTKNSASSSDVAPLDAAIFSIPYQEDSLPHGFDISSYQRLCLESHDETEKVLSACKCAASKIVLQNANIADSNPHLASIHWAIISQILQSILTGIQEPCLYEINRANGNMLGADAGFIQRAIDEEIAEICECDLCPRDEESLSAITSQIVVHALKVSKIAL